MFFSDKNDNFDIFNKNNFYRKKCVKMRIWIFLVEIVEEGGWHTIASTLTVQCTPLSNSYRRLTKDQTTLLQVNQHYTVYLKTFNVRLVYFNFRNTFRTWISVVMIYLNIPIHSFDEVLRRL